MSVFLTVGYLVESTSNNTDDFVGVLENALFETAVLAALGCQDFLMENRPKLLADTTIVGTLWTLVMCETACMFRKRSLLSFFFIPVRHL